MAFKLFGYTISRNPVQKRDAGGVSPSYSTEDPRLLSYLMGQSGLTVTEHGAMALSAVYACVSVIADEFAALPCNVLYSKNKRTEIYDNHPFHNVLKNQPYPLYNAFNFRRTVMVHKLLWGNAYARIYRDGFYKVVGLKLYMPWEVSLKTYNDRLYYNTPEGQFQSEDILHFKNLGFDGLAGKSPIRLQAESLGIDLSSQKFISQFYKKGASLSGVLMFPTKLSGPARQRIEKQFDEYTGAENAGQTAILEEGVKYQRIGVPPAEAQFLDMRKFSKEEVSAMFRVPLPMISSLENAHYANVEQLDLQFVKHTMIPHITEFEQEINNKCFRDDEKKTTYAKLNIKGLLRGDIQTQKEYYKDGIQNGWLTPNDILELEDMNPYAGGDAHWIQINMGQVEDYADRTKAQQSNANPQNN